MKTAEAKEGRGPKKIFDVTAELVELNERKVADLVVEGQNCRARNAQRFGRGERMDE